MHRQRPEQHLVEEGKDRDVRANAERQRQHGDGGDKRRLERDRRARLIGHWQIGRLSVRLSRLIKGAVKIARIPWYSHVDVR